MQKAQVFTEEEKTTIEGAEQEWGEEHSTSVEQDEVAERLRAIARNAGTNVTSTNAGLLDEPTVDDGSAGLSSSIVPARLTVQARLVVTSGSDTGQSLDVAPGKSYTIGRALDNDLVLTDLAVSRKHFDLRYESSAWVIADRGSGNGTLVNDRLEDAPFMLTHGDTIEIGNTQFRIDIPSAAPRGSSAHIQTMDASMIDDDISTVAGDVVNPDVLNDSFNEAPTNDRPVPRARTLPPPTATRALENGPRTRMPPSRPPTNNRPPTQPPPPRAQTHTGPTQPPFNAPPMRSAPAPVAPAINPAALNAMGPAAMAPVASMGQPPMAHQPMHHGQPPVNPMGARPGPMGPGMNQGMNPVMLGDPNHPPHSTLHGPGMAPLMPGRLPTNPHHSYDRPGTGAPMAIHSTTGPRGDMSTALVAATPYNGMAMVPTPGLTSGISKKTKLVLAGIGGALVLIIAIAVAASGGDDVPPAADATDEKTEAAPKDKSDTPSEKAAVDDKKPNVQPIETAKVDEGAEEKKKAAEEEKEKEKEKQRLADEKKKAEDAEKKKLAAERAEEKKADDAEKKKLAAAQAAERAEEKKLAAKKAAEEKAEKAEKKAKQQAAAKKDPPEPRTTTKEVATASSSGARSKAETQYRNKEFSAAGTTLALASRSSSGDDADELKQMSASYTALGKLYNVGMAPATKATEAWEKLTAALRLDGSVGKAHSSEIRSKLGAIAPKAATGFMSSKDYSRARAAVAFAESSGTSNSTTAAVSSGLESEAGKLFKAAQAEEASDPDAAKAKYRQIKTMVDAKSSWYQKANKAL